MNPRHRTPLLPLLILSALACSDPPDSSSDADASDASDASDATDATSPADVVEPQPGGSANYSSALGPEPDFSQPNGRIVAKTWLQYGDTELSGAFADGPAPRQHVEAQRIGACRLVTYTPSSCEPKCTGGAACVGGACLPWPTREDRGELSWQWADGQQTVKPDPTLGYYAAGKTGKVGDVTIVVGDMTLKAPSTAALEADGDWAKVLHGRAAGDDATLRWTNPMQHARVRIHMTDCVGSHGGLAPAEVECEGPDTGKIVIPGAFLDALEAGDWTHGECGSHTFERYHTATPEGDDTIRFETVAPSGLFYFPGQSVE